LKRKFPGFENKIHGFIVLRSMMNMDTVHELIRFSAINAPDTIAILGLNQRPLYYGQLYKYIQLIVSQLNEFGIGRNDRVAIVLPNGPQMAVAFLAISSGATCAPLNPSYTATEFNFYLSDLEAKALVVQHGIQSPAIDVAHSLGIPILELHLFEDIADGLFELTGGHQPPPAFLGFAQTTDVALMLHTSGTTSRPKLVPLTHKNLCASAGNICKTLGLMSNDRCLNIMPLFHIHGLIAGVLASIKAGASVACSPGFLAPEFFPWLEIFNPTWYTAVPTMHQSILTRSLNNHEIIKKVQLRFIRSSSSSLPPSVMTELEETFQTSVIEAYGMTEASHQMASNPLPPALRKAGSVGLAAGPEIAIMSEKEARFISAGTPGEIVIRGKNVTLGYAKNPEANSSSFTNGWFRTGDQGVMDEDGYLFITGRIKEIINRGGEKISPREIDEVFLKHPAVAQAVAFGVPHKTLGEDLAVALVLKDKSVNENDLRKYAANHLAFHKVPQRVIILSEIPKGSTGKIQRIGLARKLGLLDEVNAPVQDVQFVPPGTDVEKITALLWQKVLGIPLIGINDHFLDAGGDSMLATVLHMLLEEKFNIRIPLVDLFGAATIANQAILLESLLHVEK
jgi:acyl-CoA synthetase (AMP-forming)/AMP-acid ligase II/acyl carrier protein